MSATTTPVLRLLAIAGGQPAESGAVLLDRVCAFFRRFVAFPTGEAAVAVTLWAAHAHILRAFDSSPRLALLSPEPGSGKTRVLEVLELLVPAPMAVLNASPSALFRTNWKDRPTLLFDEVDAVFTHRGKDDEHQDLRALLNSGHRAGATIPRCVGPDHAVKLFPTFCATALAGLGDLPDTIMSRSVIIRMKRRAPDELVEPFRHRLASTEGLDMRRQLAEWTTAQGDRLANVFPTLPDEIVDRDADVWEPLVAIADAAGGAWPLLARQAAVALTRAARSKDSASLGLRLLADLQTVFEGRPAVSTRDLLRELAALSEAPWGDLRGKALDARGLARRLAAYGIRSRKVRLGAETAQGYTAEDLFDAWARYLPPSLPPAQVEHPEHAERGSAVSTRPVPPSCAVPEQRNRVPEHNHAPEQVSPPLSRDVLNVPDVLDLRGGEREAVSSSTDLTGPCRHSVADRMEQPALDSTHGGAVRGPTYGGAP